MKKRAIFFALLLSTQLIKATENKPKSIKKRAYSCALDADHKRIALDCCILATFGCCVLCFLNASHIYNANHPTFNSDRGVYEYQLRDIKDHATQEGYALGLSHGKNSAMHATPIMTREFSSQCPPLVSLKKKKN